MFTLIDFAGTFLIFPLTVLQVLGVFWIYGLEDFMLDLEFMVNRKISVFWRILWGVVTPFFMIIIFIYSMVNFENPTYGDREFPSAYIYLMWGIILCGAVFVCFLLFESLIRSYIEEKSGTPKDVLSKVLRKSFLPSREWGPANQLMRDKWIKYKAEYREKRNRFIKTEGLTKFQLIIYIVLGKFKFE